jgi:hypothetical protein
MACVRKRRVGKGFRWVLDYRDQQGRRHWETTKGNRKEAERLLAERVRQISRGTYQAPTERVSFEDLAQAYLKHAQATVRENTLRDYRGNLRLHLLPYLRAGRCGTFGGPMSKPSVRTCSMVAPGRERSTSA